MAFLRLRYSKLSSDDIEDIYQESSLALFHNISSKKFTDFGKLRSYFKKICINQSLKILGKKGTIPIIEINGSGMGTRYGISLANVQEVLEICSDEEEAKEMERKAKLVHSILKTMTNKCKQLLWSHYADGLSWDVIAEMNGLANANTAKATAYRCRDSFKEKYLELEAKIYGE